MSFPVLSADIRIWVSVWVNPVLASILPSFFVAD